MKYGNSVTIAVHLSAAEEKLLQDEMRPADTVCGTLGHAEEINFMVLQCCMGEFIQPYLQNKVALMIYDILLRLTAKVSDSRGLCRVASHV